MKFKEIDVNVDKYLKAINAGVYLIMIEGVIVYIGSSSELRVRLGSVFIGKSRHSQELRLALMASSSNEIEVLNCGSIKSALEIEGILIKEFKPKLNLFNAPKYTHRRSKDYRQSKWFQKMRDRARANVSLETVTITE